MTAIKMIYSDKILSEQKKKVSPKEALERRLDILSEYIESHTDKTFSEFLKEKGITKAQFISDLPVGLKNPPANDIDALTKYMNAMNFVYNKEINLSANGIVDGGYVTGQDSNVGADGKNLNGDGLGLIGPDDDKDNWVEAVTYDGSSDATLRWALGRAWTMLAEYGRQLEQKQSENDNDAIIALGMKMDDVSALIDWLSKRIEGTITAQIARSAFEERHHYRVQEWDAYLKNKTKPSSSFLDKLKTNLNDIARIAKQDWKSIVTGLQKTPKEILADLKKEAQKDLADVQKNATLHNANKYNPLFVVARKSFQKLLELNVFDLAATFNKMKNDPDQAYWNRAKKKWDNVGGELSVFEGAINKGKDKPKQLSADGGGKITGAEAGGIVAALAAATVGVGAAVGMGPVTAGIVGSAGGVVAVMVPVLAGFKNKTGPGQDVPVGEGQMPEVPTTTSEPDGMSTKMKVIIASSIGGTLLIVAGILMFGGKKV